MRDASSWPENKASPNKSRIASDVPLDDASPPVPEAPFRGFVCPPCGRFIRTEVDGVTIHGRTGSPSRFCTPGCRQAAYRRRRAGTEESARLQHKGGRRRSLSATAKVHQPKLIDPSPAEVLKTQGISAKSQGQQAKEEGMPLDE